MHSILACLALLLCSCSCIACSAPSSNRERPALRSATGEDLESLSPVVRLRLKGMPPIEAEALWLLEGELTSSHQKNLRSGEVPDALVSRRRPLASWQDKGEIVLASTELLSAGERYSLVALGYGLIAELRVAEGEQAVLRRVGSSTSSRDDELVFCADTPDMSCILSAENRGIIPGVLEDRCVRVRAEAGIGSYMIPPIALGECLLEPLPISLISAALSQGNQETSVPDEECGDSELRLGSSGCLKLKGAVASLHLGAGLHAARLSLNDEVVHQLLVDREQSSTIVWGPLEPQRRYRLKLYSAERRFPLRGHEASFEFEAPLAAPHLVLTEALLDPSGAEPQGEWIEILNAGSAEGELEGYHLLDESGRTPLSGGSLLPGQRGLIVREDFEFLSDFVPAPDAVPIRVARLGGNGLKNSGESIRLEDPEGRIVSELPSLDVDEGTSVCRSSIWGEITPGNIGSHAAPGASPGDANECESTEELP